MEQTIYKKDTKGNIRFLTVKSEGIEIVQISGIIGTDSPVEHRKEAKPKNVGRANATTAEEQSLKECEALIVDKLTKGYFNTPEEAKDEEVILPMLANSFKDSMKSKRNRLSDTETLIMQPKIDGFCLLVDIDPAKGIVKLISRQGKEITTVPHIKKYAEQFMKTVSQRIILHGELYAGNGYTFQETCSLIKKEQPGQEVLQLVVYDVVLEEVKYLDRLTFLKRLLDTNTKGFYPNNKEVFVLIPWIYDTLNTAETHHQWCIEQGYEGMMIKTPEMLYEINKRSWGNIKYKNFEDTVIVLKDVIPSDARPEQGVFVFHWEGAEDDILKSGMKFSHEEREEFLKNKDKYIGKKVELRYFGVSEAGVPRHPVSHGFRLDK